MSDFPVEWLKNTANFGKPITVRMPAAELSEFDELAKRLSTNRAILMRTALRFGLQELNRIEREQTP